MQFITNDYIQFFKDLARHNQRDWFHDNKKRYEQFVKQPFLDLLDGLIPEIQKIHPAILPDAQKAVFRINRDIRFSKDKTPYHVLMKAGLSPEGKKSELPGFYLGISAESVHLGGGLYNLSADRLQKVRAHLASNLDEFIAIYEQTIFKNMFGEIQGERNKRVPKEWTDAVSRCPYLMNKQFYAMAELPVNDLVNARHQIDFLLPYFRGIDPFIGLLKKAM